MQLKNTYSAREVAAMTGLSARQLQWWDARRVFAPAIASRPTAAGGFTERRYTPVDLLELMVLAELRRQGMSMGRIRLLLETLRERFGVRLFDAVGGAGPLTLADRRPRHLRAHRRWRVLQPAERPCPAAARPRRRAPVQGAHRESARPPSQETGWNRKGRTHAAPARAASRSGRSCRGRRPGGR